MDFVIRIFKVECSPVVKERKNSIMTHLNMHPHQKLYSDIWIVTRGGGFVRQRWDLKNNFKTGNRKINISLMIKSLMKWLNSLNLYYCWTATSPMHLITKTNSTAWHGNKIRLFGRTRSLHKPFQTLYWWHVFLHTHCWMVKFSSNIQR